MSTQEQHLHQRRTKRYNEGGNEYGEPRKAVFPKAQPFALDKSQVKNTKPVTILRRRTDT